jgi:hypothetical protein
LGRSQTRDVARARTGASARAASDCSLCGVGCSHRLAWGPSVLPAHGNRGERTAMMTTNPSADSTQSSGECSSREHGAVGVSAPRRRVDVEVEAVLGHGSGWQEQVVVSLLRAVRGELGRVANASPSSRMPRRAPAQVPGLGRGVGQTEELIPTGDGHARTTPVSMRTSEAPPKPMPRDRCQRRRRLRWLP